jgi:hypothetical protein
MRIFGQLLLVDKQKVPYLYESVDISSCQSPEPKAKRC